MAARSLRMLKAFDFPGVAALYKRDLPTPIDVPNLLHFKNRQNYRWYGALVMPLLRTFGGQLGWAGEHALSIRGESRAEELLVVRYPNQRRFISMVLTPYYMVVANPQRLKGVRRFEASFTHSGMSLDPLRATKCAVVVHFNGHPHLEAIQRTVEAGGGELVYASQETSEIALMRNPTPADPNPLLYKSMAIFRFDDVPSAQAALPAAAVTQLQEIAGDLSIQVYQRMRRSQMLPQFPGRSKPS